MAGPQHTLQGRDLHHPGEPWSVNELEHIPHLHSVAKSARDRIHANKTLRDLQFQNKQEYEDFVALCERNILFFLKVTGQFYKLSKLFEDPGFYAKWVRLVNSLRSHVKRKVHQRHLRELKNPVKDMSTRKGHNELYHGTHPAPNLSKIEKWQHYEREWHRITTNYYSKSIRDIYEVIESNLKHMNNIKGALVKEMEQAHHPVQYREQLLQQIIRLDQTHNHIAAKRQAIMAMYAPSTNPVPEHRIRVQQNNQLRELSDSAQLVFDEAAFLDTPYIKNIISQQKSIYVIFMNRMHEMDVAFKQKQEELAVGLEGSRNDMKIMMFEQINSAINSLKVINFNQLNDRDKQSISDTLSTLEDYYNKAKTSDTIGEVQLFLALCNEALKKVQAIMPNEAIPALKSNLESLDKLALLPSIAPIVAAQPNPNIQNRAESPVSKGQLSRNSFFKHNAQSLRPQKSEVLVERNESPNQKEFNANLDSITRKLSSAITNGIIKSENLILTQKILEHMDNVKKYDSYKMVSIEEMESLSTNLNTLIDNYSDLRKLKSNLNTVYGLVESASQAPNPTNIN